MITRAPELQALTPARRAEVIYACARSDMDGRLWRAALGPNGAEPAQTAERGGGQSLQSILALLKAEQRGGPADVAAPCREGELDVPPGFGPAASGGFAPAALGPNARHAAAIERAAERTGLPPAALASIIDAEAGRGRDGTWNTHSRNPRSSAAGLGQFLSGTWEHEAERRGTWLNGVAASRGWLGQNGQVLPGARAPLLALRYDPEASIQATADYARGNLDRLRRSGVEVGGEVGEVARAAYLSHHLGPGDAVRFLGDGALASGRAARLLSAQVGSGVAGRRIAEAGDPAAAHAQWLNGYVERRIRPERYLA